LLVDMLTLSRAEAGKLEFNPQPLDIPEFCDRLIDEVKGNLNTAPFIKLHIEGSDNVALLDEKLLRAILINLLLNAAKYSPEESEIGLRVECSVGKTVFKVSDRGIGIPAADQQYLYDSFHRGENVGTLPGTGLGLAVVKKCLERHGGNIQVQSEVGVGTTFRVTIPWTTTEVTL
ncbi:MAG TPA: HAMP domain-containing sensor histidine kinase, partial [Stenomitos sp.]